MSAVPQVKPQTDLFSQEPKQVARVADPETTKSVMRVADPEKYLKLYGRWMEKLADKPVEQARATTYQCVMNAWLNQHMPVTGSDLCAHCGKPHGLIAINKDCWVHEKCWETWRHTRRLQASEALREMGITPLGAKGDWNDEG